MSRVHPPTGEYSRDMDITLYMTIIEEDEKKIHETPKSQDEESLLKPTEEVSLDNKEKQL